MKGLSLEALTSKEHHWVPSAPVTGEGRDLSWDKLAQLSTEQLPGLRAGMAVQALYFPGINV